MESNKERLYKKILEVCKKQKQSIHLDSRSARRMFAKMMADATVVEGTSLDGYQLYVTALMDALSGMNIYDGARLNDKTISKAFSKELTARIIDYYNKLTQELKGEWEC